jgi:amidase
VAAGAVDFALGSDTAGSVRVPASYCGTYGVRPSWGAVSLAGACGLAPSMDTAGWFARDAAVLARVGDVLLPEGVAGALGPLLRPGSVWANARPETVEALSPALRALERLLGPALAVEVAPEGLPAVYEHARCLQAEEVWATLGGWVEETRPAFGPGVAERFAAARAMDPAKAAVGRAFRRVFAARVRALLAGGAVLAFPTAPGPAPLLSATLAEQDAVRADTMGVTAIAGLAGLCEVTLPAGRGEGGAPVGFSLAAAPGRDRALLALAGSLAEAPA